MNGAVIGSLGIAALLGLLALGVPIAWAMTCVAVGGMWLAIDGNFAFAMLEALPFDTANDYNLVVIPMFILMGGFASRAGIIEGLYEAVHRFTAGFKGNLFSGTILAAAGFAAASGSTLVASTVFTRIAMPQMVRFGYARGVAAGCIAAAGTLAALIPPSIGMVIIATLTDQSLGALLIAGIVPGVVTALAYVFGLRLFLIRYPHWAPDTGQRYSWHEKFTGLRSLWGVILLAGLIIGGIYAGLFSPSAAGAVGAAGALTIGLVSRKLGGSEIWDSLIEAALVTGRLMVILIGGLLMGRFLLISGFTDAVSGLVVSNGVSPLMLMVLISIMFIVMGMFIDSMSMIVITLPFLFPISQTLGINEIWFAIIILKLIEIAAITPPVGLNLFAVLGAAPQVSSRELFRGILPFILIDICVLVMFFVFPGLITWLPDTMSN